MKDEFYKLVRKAHLTAMAKYLLRNGVINSGTYNVMIKKIG